MSISAFDYFAPSSLSDVLRKLDEYGSELKLLAGGTDLVWALKNKWISPKTVVGLHKVRELEYVREADSNVHIGALTKLSGIAGDSFVKERLPILSEAVSMIGSWQIRNMGTIGGNLCSASPSADSAVALLALDAYVVTASKTGQSDVPLRSFFTGPGKTVLKSNELIKEIVVPYPKQRSFGCYLKLMRKKAVDLSLVGVAFQAELDGAGEKLAAVRIGLGGVAPTPIRAFEAESLLTGLGYRAGMRVLQQAAKCAVEATSPISDVRASAEYRRWIVEAYVQGAAETCIQRLFEETRTKP
jgi:CO/xanthine dehydrogenase FAD-binding subunit